MPPSHSKGERRKEVWKKTGGICAHCGKIAYGNHQTIDHFVPQSKGGGNDLRNLMPLCSKCNKDRSSKFIDPDEFYCYAPPEAIEDCKAYLRKRRKDATTMADSEAQKEAKKKNE